MQTQLTAVFRKVPEGYVAFIEELPGANTQGVTLDEARANLQEAVALVLEVNRSLAEEEFPISPTWLEEIQQRCTAIDNGTARLIDHESALKQLRARFV